MMDPSDLEIATPRPRRVRGLFAAALTAAMVASFVAAAPAAPETHDPVPSPFTAESWPTAQADRYSPKQYAGDMYWITQKVTGAADYWNEGYTGEGVDIALIDTGIVPVQGLNTKGKVYDAPDFSFDTISEPLRHLDSYGHGTHLAGIIAGKDGAAQTISRSNRTHFTGMAPDARLVNVKVGDVGGVVDVTQVIAAIDWVVHNRNASGLNIRVINLSYGTDGGVDADEDVLVHAVERAWKAGIVVVAAAGNDGNGARLRNPALSPYVISVGAADSGRDYTTSGDTVPSFSSCGTSSRSVDLVAPGKSIVSLRTPGSTVDNEFPGAAVTERFFLGSGTSQAAAVVSGAAALVIEQRPGITPDQLKALLTGTAQHMPGAKGICQGAGSLDLTVARTAATPDAKQTWPRSSGEGSLDDARGSFKIELEGDVLEGDMDVFGTEWDEPEDYYEDGEGLKLFLNGWSGLSWSGLSWSGLSWSGLSWSGLSWSGLSWSGLSWSGLSWSGLSWSGGTWSGLSWK